MITGEVMIITGTRKGVGKQLTEHYLEKGHVVAGCSRGETTIEHDAYTHFKLDISDERAVKSMVSDVYRRHNRIDVLINNAGTSSMNAIVLTPLSTVDTIFKSNVFGTFLFCREAAKIMMQMKYGRIINITSVAVPLLLEGEAVYAASKSAVETLTRIMGRELGRYNITCNNIGLSLVKTDAIRSIPQNTIQNVIDRLAIKRLAHIDDIVNVIDFLKRAESGYITGQTIYLGGV